MTEGQIYVITHKPVELILPEGYQKLYVGAEKLREGEIPEGYIPDNIGEEISAKNKNYCELTGTYWIWKNRKDSIVGITHYRRFFEIRGKLLTLEQAEKALQSADVIVAKRQWVEDSVKTHFERFHSREDLELLRNVIRDKCPEYEESFEAVLGKCFLFPYNMLVCRKDIFDSYCTWLFGILKECEKRVNIRDYDSYQSRIFGFLAERLLMVYLMHNRLKIKEMKVHETELDKKVRLESKMWEKYILIKNFITHHSLRAMRYRQ